MLQSDLDRLVQWSQAWQLHFNISKCKTMHLGSRNIGMEYTMETTSGDRIALAETKVEKDLGIWVANDLKSATTVASAVSKANRLLGLVKRCFAYLDCQLVRSLFTTMIRPHLEYGNAVWHPQYCKDINLIEGVQHRATRLVPGYWKFPYQERLRKMNLPSLGYRRLRGDALEVYKHLHGIYKVDCTELLPLDNRSGMVTRGHSLKLQKRDSKTAMRANSFGMRVVNFRNSLPEEVVQAPSVNVFKQRFDALCERLNIQYSEEPDLGRQPLRTSES